MKYQIEFSNSILLVLYHSMSYMFVRIYRELRT